jgi:hypothetical protein
MNRIMHDGERRAQRPATVLQRMARGFVNVLQELDYAQRRSSELFLARYADLPTPGPAAGTYADFLARTSGRLIHEPSAAARRTGRPVR